MNKIFMYLKNNFSAYKLIEGWPNWPEKWLNVFGASGSGKLIYQKFWKKNKKS